MSKLFSLKDWLTLDEAVIHISNMLGEPIALADIYKLALDGHLKISANFVNSTQAKKVMLLKNEDVKSEDNPRPTIKSINSLKYAENGTSENCWIKTAEDELFMINGLWDLTMLGNERTDIEHRYQQETSGISVKGGVLCGVYIQQGDVLCQLYTSAYSNPSNKEKSASKEREIKRGLLSYSSPYINHRPENRESNGSNESEHKESIYDKINYFAVGLDEEENVLVIRTSEVTRFIQSLENTPQEAKPLTSKERNSLLVLLGAVFNNNDIDPNQRGISTSLVRMTELIAAPLSDDTILKILKQIKPAIESRSK